MRHQMEYQAQDYVGDGHGKNLWAPGRGFLGRPEGSGSRPERQIAQGIPAVSASDTVELSYPNHQILSFQNLMMWVWIMKIMMGYI